MRGLAISLLLLLTACSIQSPSKNQTETFTGTLQPGGVATKAFTGKSGEYHITLDALTPDNTLLDLELWQGSCQSGLPINRVFTGISSVGLSGLMTPSAYCVVLIDPGALQRADTFTITISHP